MSSAGKHSGLILVVDDDENVRGALHDTLEDQGYQVAEAATGAAARVMAAALEPDLVLLDLGLPDISGLDILIDLTGGSAAAPVIILSGRSGDTETAIGLDLGADDYITKPFSERVLLARINAALRRAGQAKSQPRLKVGGLVIDPATRDVVVDEQLVDLTAREFDLLVFLASAPRQVFTRKQLLEQVWGSSPQWQHENTVGEHIYRIRRKLATNDRDRWIETVRGVGYRFTGIPD